MGKALGRSDAADIIKNNIELKVGCQGMVTVKKYKNCCLLKRNVFIRHAQVENETLKKSLSEKNDLLVQASSAIEDLENQQRAWQLSNDAEKQTMYNQLECLRKV